MPYFLHKTVYFFDVFHDSVNLLSSISGHGMMNLEDWKSREEEMVCAIG